MKKLSDQIWETRKCRINKETRLVRYARITEILVPWYSVHLVIVALWSLNDSTHYLNLVSIAGSVAVLVFSIVISSARFRMRGRDVREQYIALGGLTRKAAKAEQENDLAALASIAVDYDELLSVSENHSEGDYSKLKMQMRRTTEDNKTVPDPTFVDFVRRFADTCGAAVLVAILFAAPTVALVLMLGR